jgi:hypothetical protein
MPTRRQLVRWTFYGFGLLGVNFLVTFASMLAFVLFLFRDDPILAAVPAAVALPAILLQPWFLVFFFVPRGMTIAPWLTTLFTIFVYTWLNSDGRLERPKRFLLRFKTRRTVTIVGGLVLLAIAVSAARYVDFPAARRGTPPPIRMADLTLTESRYYCLGQFIDSQWLWQARLSESEMSRLAEHYSLYPIDRSELPDEFRRMAPYWWHPTITERTTVLSTSSFPLHERGPDGLHALATWNPDDQVLHVWIKNNF